MSELNQVTSGTNSSTSGDEKSKELLNATSGADDSKSQDKNFDKILKEKRNYQLALDSKEKELAQIKAENDAYKEKELLEKKQFDTVHEINKKKISELELKVNELEGVKKNAQINTALMGEIKKFGFVDNDSNREILFKLVDKKNVEIDPTTNQVIGAAETAKEFYNKFNSLGIFGKTDVGANHNAADLLSNSKPLTLEEWNKLPREEKIKREPELNKTLGIVRTK